MAKILILMMETGSGHKVPALAVKEAILKKDPQSQVDVLDILNELSCDILDTSYKMIWKTMLEKPWILKPFYKMTSSEYIDLQSIESIIVRRFENSLLDFIRSYKPDIIFSTHFTIGNAISRLKKSGRISTPDILLVTDPFYIHPVWVQGHNSYYIIFNKDEFSKLIRRGIRRSQLICLDYPIRSVFSGDAAVRKGFLSRMRKKLNLPRSAFVATLIAGGEGIGNLDHQLDAYAKEDLPITFLVICGKNKEVYDHAKRLEDATEASRINIRAYGFVDNVHEILGASDIAIGKSGANFMFETLVMKIPFLVTHTLENESAGVQYLLSRKVGWKETDIEKQIKLLKYLYDNPSELKGYKQRLIALDIKNGSEDIAGFILSKAHPKAKASKSRLKH